MGRWDCRIIEMRSSVDHASVVEPSAETDRVARSAVDAAVAVHRALGPGYPERIYAEAYEFELRSRGHKVECERTSP